MVPGPQSHGDWLEDFSNINMGMSMPLDSNPVMHIAGA